VIPNVAGFLSNLFSGPPARVRASGSLENPSTDINDPELWDSMGSRSSASGITVGPEDALKFGPVYQCLEIKSADIGTATLHCHKTTAEPGEDDIDYNQSAENVCSLAWNDVTPANEGWQNLVFHNQLFGSGYAYISRQGGARNGRILWMANLVPTMVQPVSLPETGLMYELTLGTGQKEYLNPWEVFHLRGLALQPNRPLQLLNLMRDELGLALAAKLWLSKFFQRGGHHGGILMIPPGVKKSAQENLERGVAKRADPSGWFKTMILRDGAKWESSTIDPRTAQMHELSDDEARAVCHFFNMPPWKLGIRDSESYNSAEQAGLAYIRGTLLHVSKRIRGEAQIKLLSERTMRARTHKFEHDFTDLLATDIKTLNEILEIQRRNEVINANEYRRRVNMPLRADDKASQYYNPNTRSDKKAAGTDQSAATTDNSGNAAENEVFSIPRLTDNVAPSQSSGSGIVTDTQRALLEAASGKAAKRLITICRNKARRPDELLAWIDSNGGEHRSIVSEELALPLQVVFDATDRQNVMSVTLASEEWFCRQVTSGVGQFLNAPHKQADLSANVETWCAEWLGKCSQNWFKEIINA